MSNNQPVHEVRLGHVKCAIFANETQAGIRHNVKISRLWKDGDKWATTQVFGRDDLPLLAKVSDLAHTWIFAETQNGLSGSGNGHRKHENES